ncbi:hypothetical protein MBLNU459_g2051t1 [Dothideomycetes sp. NU459]
MAQAPTLIDLPEGGPPTPSDAPGTPNSTTTSMSELSTVAIKDGHRGHLPHTHNAQHPATGTLDAERADRISRLAGLERVTTARNPTPVSNLTPGYAAPPAGTSGYFDPQGNPVLGRERSTVGSASATGSVGGRTTWASETDQMSESQDMDMDTSSVGGTSDTNSLVGFGEGARTPARHSGYGSPSVGKATPTAAASTGPPPPFANIAGVREASASANLTPLAAPAAAADYRDAKMSDGATHDHPGGAVGPAGGAEAAERILRERLGPDDTGRALESPGSGNGTDGLGRFYFETK